MIERFSDVPRLHRHQVLWGLSGVLLALAAAMNYSLWVSPDNIWGNVQALRGEIATLVEKNQRLEIGNQGLQAEIASLRDGLEAVESRARTSLGLIQRGETLFRPRPDVGL